MLTAALTWESVEQSRRAFETHQFPSVMAPDGMRPLWFPGASGVGKAPPNPGFQSDGQPYQPPPDAAARAYENLPIPFGEAFGQYVQQSSPLGWLVRAVGILSDSAIRTY
jgi:hypothetical protein